MRSEFLGVPTLQSFVDATKPQKGFFKKRFAARGGKIALIDATLRAWAEANRPGQGNETKLKALGTIVTACSWWLNQKEHKVGAQTQTRRNAIEIVLKRALGAMKGLSPGLAIMERNKSTAIRRGERVTSRVQNGRIVKQGIVSKSLDGNYQLERDFYVANGKGATSVAAGAVHMSCPDIGKNFDDLVLADFTTVLNRITQEFNSAAPACVAYLPKAERVEFLAAPDSNGRFLRPNGALVRTDDVSMGTRISDMWAMDRYGNLFVRRSGRINGRGAEYFNHSSFCAGNEVICAGTILMNDGSLVYIDNNSGHYKPGIENLRESLAVLVEHNVPMENVRVGVVRAGGAMDNYDAVSMLYQAEPTPWDHGRDDGLRLPRDINSGR